MDDAVAMPLYTTWRSEMPDDAAPGPSQIIKPQDRENAQPDGSATMRSVVLPVFMGVLIEAITLVPIRF